MKKIISRWWVWLVVILFIVLNLLVTSLGSQVEDNHTKNRILNGHIDTH